MKSCLVCTVPLTGRQRKFCSRQCKNDFGNNRHQSYVAQQKRGRTRKNALVVEFGGCCTICGYKKNYAALEFHHRDGTLKGFEPDLRSLSNRAWSISIAEAQKCDLVCSNCHRELHNPECAMVFSRNAFTSHDDARKEDRAVPGFLEPSSQLRRHQSSIKKLRS